MPEYVMNIIIPTEMAVQVEADNEERAWRMAFDIVRDYASAGELYQDYYGDILINDVEISVEHEAD